MNTDDTGVGIASCSPALELFVSEEVVETGGFSQVWAIGGTGQYVYELFYSASGAMLGANSGGYVAGEQAGAIDRIRVTDLGCAGQDERTIEVVSPMRVAPERVDLAFETALNLSVDGGTGRWSCAWVQANSGGTLGDGCEYTSGNQEGVDIIEVEDNGTGARAQVLVSVAREHRLMVEGWGGVILPLGGGWVPEGTGGSGVWDLSVISGPLISEDGRVRATEEGQGFVRLVDRYVPTFSSDVPVTATALRTADLPRDGERSGEGVAVGLGDVDGDGFPDAALGFIEMSIHAWTSGGVAIYAGTDSGLSTEPVRVIGGTDSEQTLGRAVAAADLNRDGWVDLVVGADRADRGATNNGVVTIYDGVPGQFFSETPSRTLVGSNPYGRLGSALAVCDFNGDGSLDLAVGAIDDADQNVAVPADKQGAIHVFLGDQGTFGDEADFVLYGQIWDGDAWNAQAGMGLGYSLAAGDVDGDGLCDLAAGAPESNDGDGAAWLYLGSDAVGVGLERAAVAQWRGPSGGELGRRLAMGDVDGDGRHDLFLTAWMADTGATGAGGVWGVFGANRSGADIERDLADADWMRFGSTSYERVGTSIDVADLDQDGRADVLIGAYRDEVGSGVNEGTVMVFAGADLRTGAEASEADAWMVIEGIDAEDRLGQAVGALGDLTGDGIGDILALAGYDSAEGIETGAVYFLAGEDSAAPALLELPGESAGHGIGQSFTWFDVDGDGVREVLSGAPDAGDAEVGANAGVLLAWSTDGERIDNVAQSLLGGHDAHDATDRYAHAVENIGDFDGDGFDDLAVVARKDSRPAAFDAEVYANPDECAGSRTQAGAVYLYRGSADGLDPTPAFVYYGPDAYGFVEIVVGAFDRNGDGYGDIAIASTLWATGGGVDFLYGRPGDPAGRTVVLCDSERYEAGSPFDRLGTRIAVLGDLDQDGCDEVVVAASGEEAADGASNQGIVRVFYGTCGDEYRQITLGLDVIGTEAGTALDAGADVDGDGLADLAVGAAAYRNELVEVGAAWVVPGQYLLALDADAHAPGAWPDDPTVHSLLDTDGPEGLVGVIGQEAGVGFGAAVAFVPPDGTESWRLAVGAPYSAAGGSPYSGAVWVYRWFPEGSGQAGLDPQPWGLVVGDSASGEAQLGATLDVVPGDTPWLLVGVPLSDAGNLDGGGFLPVVF